MSINQVVIFTKPIHHLKSALSPEELNERARRFFQKKGFRFVLSKTVTGSELKARDVIKQHYQMYSTAACAETLQEDIGVKERFEAFFHKTWEDELDAERIVSMPQLLQRSRIDARQLYTYWLARFDAGQTVKLRDGLIMGFIEELNAYGINAFYPSLEAIFYHPETVIHYHVLEFDPSETSWKEFRQNVLGVTNAAKADPDSLRGTLYLDHPVEFPGRDNYVHGSAGPLEGLVERTIHEAEMDITTNPVGAYLAGQGFTRQSFVQWCAKQSLETLSNLFDETEEKNTDEIFQTLDGLTA